MRLPIPIMERHKQQQRNMPYLPREMIEDILLKLPLKSLIRFRCLSKSWYSLITHPSFARMHVKRNLTNSHHHNSLIIQFHEPFWHLNLVKLGATQRPLILPNIVSPDKYFTITGCCDGILCIIQGYGTLVLWNPTIGDYKRLSLPDAFDGPQEGNGIGFGYDSSIDDYKVVRVKSDYFYDRRRPTVVEVLTLKSNSWRRVYDDLPFIISSSSEQFICANGGLYCLANATIGLGPGSCLSRTTILCFDLVEEKFSEVPLPTGIVALISLGILGGCLCMFSDTTTLDSQFDLWVMKGDTWVKLLTIPKFLGADSKDYLRPLGFTKDGVVFEHLEFANLKVGRFIIYEPKDNTFRKFTVDGKVSSFQMTMHAESLVSPCASNGNSSQYLKGYSTCPLRN